MQKPPAKRSRLLFWFLVATALLAWASGTSAIMKGLAGYSPLQLLTFRLFVASAVLIVAAFWLGVRIPHRRDALAIFGAGLFVAVAFNLTLHYGVGLTTASVAGFLSNAPVFTVLLAATFLREKITRELWLGLAATVVGIWIISLSLGGGFGLNAGCLVLVASALLWSIFSVIQKPLLNRYTPFEVTCYFTWTGAALLLVFLPGTLAAARSAKWEPTLAALYLGVFPTVVAYLCWAFVSAEISVSEGSLYTSAIPVASAFIAAVWLGERPSLLFMAGAALILVGIFLAGNYEKPDMQKV